MFFFTINLFLVDERTCLVEILELKWSYNDTKSEYLYYKEVYSIYLYFI